MKHLLFILKGRASIALLTFGLLLVYAATGYTADYPWAAGHTYWTLAGKGYKKLNVNVRVTDRPTSLAHGDFYAMQFWTRFGEAGYAGLQRRAKDQYGVIRNMAIFSIWGASKAEGTWCEPFDHEGDGYSCKISYTWFADRTYKLIVERDQKLTNYFWWAAYIKDLKTGVKTYIGRIRVPRDWGNLKGSTVNFTEYFGTGSFSCTDIQFTRVVFDKMRGVRSSDGVEKKGTPSTGKPGSGECKRSNVNTKGTNKSSYKYIHRAGERRSPGDLPTDYEGAAFLSNRNTDADVQVWRVDDGSWVSTTLKRGTVVRLEPYSASFYQFFRKGETYMVFLTKVHSRLSAHEWY